MTPGYAKTRDELHHLPYRSADKMLIINAHNFGGGGGAGWTPGDITTSLWLDGADSSTLYDATTGGSLVAADGEIARWEDKSGNSRHATQASAGARPIRKTAIQNGRDVLRLAGSQSLGLAASISGLTSANLIFVAKNVNDPAAGILTSGFPANRVSSAAQDDHYPFTDGNIYSTAFSTARKTIGNPAKSLASWRIISQTSATSAFSFFIDGDSFFSTASNTFSSNAAMFIGRSLSAYSYVGDIAEIIVIPNTDTTDRQLAEGYLAHKWDLAGELPGGHPYKSAAP
jgi:hypothetical protein